MPNADAAESETGLADVLIDDQLHVTSTLEHYMHRVRKVTSAAGIEDGAEIEITVAVADVPKHLETLASIRDSPDENAHLAAPVPAKPPVDEKIYLWVGFGFFAFFFGAIVVVIAAAIAWASGRRLRWRPIGHAGS